MAVMSFIHRISGRLSMCSTPLTNAGFVPAAQVGLLQAIRRDAWRRLH